MQSVKVWTLEYDRRLKVAGLMSLEARRERADLLEVLKILNKFEGVQEEDFFVRNKVRGRAVLELSGGLGGLNPPGHEEVV